MGSARLVVGWVFELLWELLFVRLFVNLVVFLCLLNFVVLMSGFSLNYL